MQLNECNFLFNPISLLDYASNIVGTTLIVTPNFIYGFNKKMSTHAIKKMNDKEFYQWFVGFCDGESNFSVYLRNSKKVNFLFRIELHIDDIQVLNIIRERLGCGVVTQSKTKNSAYLIISGTNDIINILFPIFEEFPLNTTKYLDYLVFKKVLELYKNKVHLTETGMKIIGNLLSGYNKNRTNFIMPAEHQINITPYWFLGFCEAEGSFSIGKSESNNKMKFYSQFTIALAEHQKAVLVEIKHFLDLLGINKLCPELHISRCNITYRKSRSSTANPQYALVISDTYFIYHFFIPFLDNLLFISKKGLDYQDWKLGVEVLVRGLHLIDAGQTYLLSLMSRINSGRLTSNQNKIRALPLPTVDILSCPPLYEFGAYGEIRVISTSQTVTEAKYYMVTPVTSTVQNSKLNTDVSVSSILPTYLQGKAELCNFFGLSDVTIYKSINKGKAIMSKKTGITYTVTKIY